jgi:hypothetical protein
MRPIFSLLVLTILSLTGVARADRAFYVGSGGKTVLHDVHVLPDGSVLVAGGTEDVQWFTRNVKDIKLDGKLITSQPGTKRVGFLLHLDAKLDRIIRAYHFPPGVTDGIRRIRTSGTPAVGDSPAKPGDIYISGFTVENRDQSGGYFIAKLDGDFSGKVPTKVEWVRNIWAGSSHREYQPWDVGSDGKVVYVIGVDFKADWVMLGRLNARGEDDVVPHFRYHWGRNASGHSVDGHWTPATARTDYTPQGSGVVFKIWRADLRSWTADEYNAVVPDGNGGTRQGSWPNDYYFAGPANPDDLQSSHAQPGYTGYRVGRNQTHRVVAVAVDRRDGSIYAGYSVQSRLPDGLPDFEPAVIAWDVDGKLKWWSRLYTENNEHSEPDQYVDGIAIDYANDRLIVGARSHGNNVINLWDGTNSFKNKLNGKTGNIHISWIGSLKLSDGSFVNSAWLSELADTNKGLGKTIESGLLAGWPDPNGGWADMNTTRLRDLRVDSAGNIFVAAVGRRPYTTSNAFMQMYKPSEGRSRWSDFTRVYTADLSQLKYSSIVNTPWKGDTDGGSTTIQLHAIHPIATGLISVGTQNLTKEGQSIGPINIMNAPEYASPLPDEAGIILLKEFE